MPITDRTLEPLIHFIRNQRVILDADLAHLYGISTKRFNEAVRRNQSRFPAGLTYRPWAFTEHDATLRDIYRKLSPLVQPPPDPPKRRIGFHTDGD